MARGDRIAHVRNGAAAQVDVAVAAADPDGMHAHLGFSGPRLSRLVLHEAKRLGSVQDHSLPPAAHRKAPWAVGGVKHMGRLLAFDISGVVRNCVATIRSMVRCVNGLHTAEPSVSRGASAGPVNAHIFEV
ncbi:hypothetical protein Shyd_94890 [Streptomyces hydrogenans]|uniref:Uncharacterized protein n=1 Tax=Streptomyces hydrogenans TaxID=1873719 RepID=A0ABQ3PSW5_9ACTN|nr:hypothetical protein GCM10018784_07030 [Streptomyces hydrogenans]GHI28118.1 hypothetical protein Shyd_94890 [Streptomyces hydrogenans]